MKFLDEYRDPQLVHRLAAEIRRTARRPWTVMEICGGQTHSILRYGLEQLLPPTLTLVHGPGCPVCVTPVELIDHAIRIALKPGCILCTFGDMLRVPGTEASLLQARAAGGHVRMVYSPLDALRLALEEPQYEVVFFAVGFETTAPATAMAVREAAQRGIKNFSLLVAHVLVPPAIRAILNAPSCQVRGFLAPGHVCTVVGYEEYERIARDYRVPIVVTGFEPADLLDGLRRLVAQLEAGRAEVENQYSRAVKREGNPQARQLIEEVYQVTDRRWRGMGWIPASGLELRPEYREFDAALKFPCAENEAEPESATECIAGLVLQGLRKPNECPAFATRCTPESPLGAPMVSSEGACAAYYRYGRSA